MSDLFRNHIVGFPTRRLNYVYFSPGAFGGKPSGPDGDSLTRPKSIQYTDPNKVDFIFYSLSISHINSAINRLEKLIDSDLVNKVFEDSVIEQLTGDQV